MPIDETLSSESDDDTTQSYNTGGQPTKRTKLLGTQHQAEKRKAEAVSNNDELVYEYSDSDTVMSDNDEIIADTVETETTDKIDKTDKTEKRVWQRGVDEFDESIEQLEYDATAYTMLHRFHLEWPCLTFDTINDNLGLNRTKFPHTMTIVTGSQADTAKHNKLSIVRVNQLHKTKQHSDENSDDSDSDSDIDTDTDPVVTERSCAHNGTINRLRCMPQNNAFVAVQSDTGAIEIYDMSELIQSLDQTTGVSSKPIQHSPVYTHTHKAEGYAIDWSTVTPGQFATGQCNKDLYVYTMNNTQWILDGNKYTGHTDSVEDIQWSYSESNVFASCSMDKTIRIWDTRVYNKSAAFVVAHKTDVNVISWNSQVQHLLASGSDNGELKIWDLRKFVSSQPAASFAYHTDSITSIEWHPTDESVLACSSSDGQLSIWDLALEADTEEEQQYTQGAQLTHQIPAQLFFIHQGQQNMKELHWSEYMEHGIICTAEDGYNVFIASNMNQTM